MLCPLSHYTIFSILFLARKQMGTDVSLETHCYLSYIACTPSCKLTDIFESVHKISTLAPPT